MLQPGRNFNSGDYEYGFNGKRMDSEVSGTGNSYDYGFRVYNPRIGKFLSVDPLTKDYPWYTPYQFAGNKPIWAIDLDGLEELIVTEYFTEGETEPYTTKITVVRDYYVGGAKNEHQIIHRSTVTADVEGKIFKVKYVGTDKNTLKAAEKEELSKGFIKDGTAYGINTTTLDPDYKGETYFLVPYYNKDGEIILIKKKIIEIKGDGAAPENDLVYPKASVNNIPSNPEDRTTTNGESVAKAKDGVYGTIGGSAKIKSAGDAQGGSVETKEETENGQTIIREAN